jgi:elongation factor P
MIAVNELRAGTTFTENNEIFQVISYEHIKMGRGSANIKIKVRNLRTGSIVEKGYTNGVTVSDIQLQNKTYQYLYKDAHVAFFMDPETYEQHEIPLKSLAGNEYLKEGENVILQFYGEEPLSLQLPPKVTLKVTETPPGVRGDSASNVYKDATLENGIKVRVPLFIDIGDSVIVDTRDGSYTKRA